MMQLGMEEEILSPCIDLVFKAMFTRKTPESEGALKDFLSSIIGRQVVDVMIQENELAVESIEEKQSAMDLHCVFNDGERANVEIQACNRGNMCVRSEYYLCKLHGKQPLKGKIYENLKPTYQITIVNYTLFPADKFFFDAFEYRSRHGRELEGGRTHIYFIELTKLDELLKKPVAEMTRPEMWAYYFKYVNDVKQRSRMNELMEKEGALAMASKALQEIARDDAMRIQLFCREKAEMDREHDLAYTLKQGIEQGIEQGIGQGIEQVILRMLKEKMDFQIISIATGVPVEEVEKYQKKLLN